MRGATILPHAVFDVPAVLARIGKDRVSALPGPPTLYQTILAHPDLQKFDLSSLRLAITGAAVIPVELIHRMRSELGFETIITGYGLTEPSGGVSMCRQEDDGETIATTSGRAMYEKALAPYSGMTANAILLEVDEGYFAKPIDERLATIDEQLAAIFADGTQYTQPRDLSPFPILGTPGWDADNSDESYYDNTKYFRPGRRDRNNGHTVKI